MEKIIAIKTPNARLLFLKTKLFYFKTSGHPTSTILRVLKTSQALILIVHENFDSRFYLGKWVVPSLPHQYSQWANHLEQFQFPTQARPKVMHSLVPMFKNSIVGFLCNLLVTIFTHRLQIVDNSQWHFRLLVSTALLAFSVFNLPNSFPLHFSICIIKPELFSIFENEVKTSNNFDSRFQLLFTNGIVHVIRNFFGSQLIKVHRNHASNSNQRPAIEARLKSFANRFNIHQHNLGE